MAQQCLPSKAAVVFLAAALVVYSGPASGNRMHKTKRFAPTLAHETRNEWQTRQELMEESDSSQMRMINSDATKENQYPYMVALLLFNNETKAGYDYQCGGSLISPTHILTAAHCVVDDAKKIFKTNLIKVALGAHFVNTTSHNAQLTKTIRRIKIHKDYNAEELHSDIAILTLKSPVKFTETISPVCLPPPESNDQYEGELAIAKGWGDTEKDGAGPGVLHHAVKKIISNSRCQKLYGATEIFDHNLCTYRRGKHFCNGDSGSPLVIETDNLDSTNEASDSPPEGSNKQECQWIQVGIVSWGFCEKKNLPDVYPRVTSFLPWIKEEMAHLPIKSKLVSLN